MEKRTMLGYNFVSIFSPRFCHPTSPSSSSDEPNAYTREVSSYRSVSGGVARIKRPLGTHLVVSVGLEDVQYGLDVLDIMHTGP